MLKKLHETCQEELRAFVEDNEDLPLKCLILEPSMNHRIRLVSVPVRYLQCVNPAIFRPGDPRFVLWDAPRHGLFPPSGYMMFEPEDSAFEGCDAPKDSVFVRYRMFIFDHDEPADKPGDKFKLFDFSPALFAQFAEWSQIAGMPVGGVFGPDFFVRTEVGIGGERVKFSAMPLEKTPFTEDEMAFLKGFAAEVGASVKDKLLESVHRHSSTDIAALLEHMRKAEAKAYKKWEDSKQPDYVRHTNKDDASDSALKQAIYVPKNDMPSEKPEEAEPESQSANYDPADYAMRTSQFSALQEQIEDECLVYDHGQPWPLLRTPAGCKHKVRLISRHPLRYYVRTKEGKDVVFDRDIVKPQFVGFDYKPAPYSEHYFERFRVACFDRGHGDIKLLDFGPSLFDHFAEWALNFAENPGGSFGPDFVIKMAIQNGGVYPAAMGLEQKKFTDDEVKMICELPAAGEGPDAQIAARLRKSIGWAGTLKSSKSRILPPGPSLSDAVKKAFEDDPRPFLMPDPLPTDLPKKSKTELFRERMNELRARETASADFDKRPGLIIPYEVSLDYSKMTPRQRESMRRSVCKKWNESFDNEARYIYPDMTPAQKERLKAYVTKDVELRVGGTYSLSFSTFTLRVEYLGRSETSSSDGVRGYRWRALEDSPPYKKGYEREAQLASCFIPLYEEQDYDVSGIIEKLTQKQLDDLCRFVRKIDSETATPSRADAQPLLGRGPSETISKEQVAQSYEFCKKMEIANIVEVANPTSFGLITLEMALEAKKKGFNVLFFDYEMMTEDARDDLAGFFDEVMELAKASEMMYFFSNRLIPFKHVVSPFPANGCKLCESSGKIKVTEHEFDIPCRECKGVYSLGEIEDPQAEADDTLQTRSGDLPDRYSKSFSPPEKCNCCHGAHCDLHDGPKADCEVASCNGDVKPPKADFPATPFRTLVEYDQWVAAGCPTNSKGEIVQENLTPPEGKTWEQLQKERLDFYSNFSKIDTFQEVMPTPPEGKTWKQLQQERSEFEPDPDAYREWVKAGCPTTKDPETEQDREAILDAVTSTLYDMHMAKAETVKISKKSWIVFESIYPGSTLVNRERLLKTFKELTGKDRPSFMS